MQQDNGRTMRQVLRGAVVTQTVVKGQTVERHRNNNGNRLLDDPEIAAIDAFVATLRNHLTHAKNHKDLTIQYTKHNEGLLFFAPKNEKNARTVLIGYNFKAVSITAWFGTFAEIQPVEKFYELTAAEVNAKLALGADFDMPVSVLAPYNDLQHLTTALTNYLA